QRLVTSPTARRTVSEWIAARLRRRHGAPPGEVVDLDARQAADGLRRDGVALLSPLLSPAAVADMAGYFQCSPVVGPDGRLTRLEELPPQTAAAAYPLETVLGCPGLPAVLNAPSVLNIAADYLGCKPTLSSVGVRWSLPSAEGGARFHEFHRDVDDWRFLKLFVYLTDVDEDSGPHAYVRGSHTIAFGWTSKAYSQAEIERRFGADSLTTITGAKGASFMADTLGVHRGGRPALRPRLMLQVQYSLLPIFAF